MSDIREQTMSAVDELLADGTFALIDGQLTPSDPTALETELTERREERKASELSSDDSHDQERLILGFALHGEKDNSETWAKFRQALGLRPDQPVPESVWSEPIHGRLSDEIDAIFRGTRDVRTLNGRTLIESYKIRVERDQASGSVQALAQVVSELRDEAGSFVENDMLMAVELLQSARARSILRLAGLSLDHALKRDRKVETVVSDMMRSIESAKALVAGRMGDDIEFDQFETLHDALVDGMLSQKAESISTGIRALDIDLQGGVNPMQTGKLNCIAARTGVGKTTIAVSAAMNLCINGAHTLFLSCELDGKEIGARAMSAYAYHHRLMGCKSWILEGRGTRREVPADYQELRERWVRQQQGGAIGSFASKALFHASAEDMVDAMYAAKARDPQLSAVFLDHFHALRPSKGYNNRSQEMEARTLFLHQAAKACKVDLFLMAQLNRETKFADAPGIEHINGTDAIGQLSTAVWLLEFPKRQEGEPFDPSRLVLHHGKTRNGQRDSNGQTISEEKTGLITLRDYTTVSGEFAV